MSCEKNGNKAGAAASSNGIAATNSKSANLAGVMTLQNLKLASQQARSGLTIGLGEAKVYAAKAREYGSQVAGVIDEGIERGGRMLAPSASVLLNASDVMPPSVKGKVTGLGMAAAAGMINALKPKRGTGFKGFVIRTALESAKMCLPVMRLFKVHRALMRRVQRDTMSVGNLMGALSRTESAGAVMVEKRKMFFFKSQEPVTLWNSRLTPVINQRELMGTNQFTGQSMVSGDGVMFKLNNNMTWHRGTTVVKTSNGEQRTITHLQGMAYPAPHYYFNRPITDEQAVGVAMGRVRPDTIPGFVGAVSAEESGVPVVAESRHFLIRSQIYWAPKGEQA